MALLFGDMHGPCAYAMVRLTANAKQKRVARLWKVCARRSFAHCILGR